MVFNKHSMDMIETNCLRKGDFSRVSVVEINIDGVVKRCVKKELIKHVNLNEIEVLKKLSGHPHICKMLWYVQTYIIMEYYYRDLYQYFIMKECIMEDQNEIERIIYECVDAIHAVHMLGYVHRDIKMENIFLDERMSVKLGDFGSVVKVGKSVPPNISWGTPMYMAPEVLNRSAVVVTEAMDWWSLGVVTYELSTGYLPWGENDSSMKEMLDLVESHDMRPIRRKNLMLKDLIEGFLEKDPADRFGYMHLDIFLKCDELDHGVDMYSSSLLCTGAPKRSEPETNEDDKNHKRPKRIAPEKLQVRVNKAEVNKAESIEKMEKDLQALSKQIIYESSRLSDMESQVNETSYTGQDKSSEREYLDELTSAFTALLIQKDELPREDIVTKSNGIPYKEYNITNRAEDEYLYPKSNGISDELQASAREIINLVNGKSAKGLLNESIEKFRRLMSEEPIYTHAGPFTDDYERVPGKKPMSIDTRMTEIAHEIFYGKATASETEWFFNQTKSDVLGRLHG
jgi:serine/threonine protein kinase